MSKNLPLSSHAQRLEITAPLPLGACIQAVEQALAEMGAAIKHESFDRRRITAHTYKSVVGFAQEKLYVTIADMGADECLIQMISEQAYQTPLAISDLGRNYRNIEAFREAFERFIPVPSN